MSASTTNRPDPFASASRQPGSGTGASGPVILGAGQNPYQPQNASKSPWYQTDDGRLLLLAFAAAAALACLAESGYFKWLTKPIPFSTSTHKAVASHVVAPSQPAPAVVPSQPSVPAAPPQECAVLADGQQWCGTAQQLANTNYMLTHPVVVPQTYYPTPDFYISGGGGHFSIFGWDPFGHHHGGTPFRGAGAHHGGAGLIRHTR